MLLVQKSLKHATLATTLSTVLFTHLRINVNFCHINVSRWFSPYEIGSMKWRMKAMLEATSPAAVRRWRAAFEDSEVTAATSECQTVAVAHFTTPRWISFCLAHPFSSFYLHATLHFEGESHKYENYEAVWITQEAAYVCGCQIFLHDGSL